MTFFHEVSKLASQHPDLFGFVRRVPHGLAIEETAERSVRVTIWPTFCVLSGHSGIVESALFAPLERLRISVEHSFALRPEVSMFGEILWVYSYARAKRRDPSLNYLTGISEDTRATWQVVARNCQLSVRITAAQQLQSLLLCAFDVPGSSLLRRPIPPEWWLVWQAAIDTEDVQGFLEYANRTLGLDLEQDLEHFHKLETPKRRVVLHQVAGMSGGTLATCPFAELQTVEELERFQQFLIHNPIIFENHDRAKPIGLSFCHHIELHGGGKASLHGNIYVIIEDFWKRRHLFNGFSMGIFRNG
jgi:hypothetical protein